MAFNPFHRFRKHQRTVFAALTILCMITFVMSSGFGGGDFFSEVRRFFGGRAAYPELVSLNGHKYTNRELINLREQRRVANQFIGTAVFVALNNAESQVRMLAGAGSKLDEPTKADVTRALDQVRQVLSQPQPETLLFLAQSGLQGLESRLTSAKRNDEARLIKAYRELLPKQLYMMHFPKDDLYPQENLYFGGSLTPDGIVQFVLMKNEADRMGIRLSLEDVNEAIKQETMGRLTERDWEAVQSSVGIGRNLSHPQLIEAVTTEFRVRIAQTALLGYDPGGFPNVPSPITPSELYDFYVKQRTELNVKLLPLPVSKFLPEVTEKPTDEELQKLFEDYKNEEYSPTRDKPGFKQPRRVKVEWIEASATSAAYRQRSRERLLAEIAGAVGQANVFSGLAAFKPFYDEYQSSKTFGNIKLPDWTEGQSALSFYSFANERKPDAMASLMGQLAASSVQGNPLAPIVTAVGIAAAREAKPSAPYLAKEAEQQAPAVVSILGAGINETLPIGVLGSYLATGRTERYLPMDAIQGDLVAKVLRKKAEELVASSIEQFRKDMDAKRSKPADVKQVIEKALKEYQWEHGESKELRDQYSLATDPGLSQVKEAYLYNYSAQDPKGKNMAATLFFQPQQSRTYTPLGLYSGNGVVMFWKTADESPKVLKFQDVKAEVEKAWRWEKARAKAEKAAEELVKKAKGDALPVFKDAAKQYGQEPFDLLGVARLKNVVQALSGPGGLAPYKVPEDKVEYPSTDFAEKLLSMKEQGVVETLTDMPKSHYYVAVLTQKIVPTLTEFQKDTAPRGFRQNEYMERLEKERRKEYRLACLKQLEDKARYAVLDQEALDNLRQRGGNMRDDY